jgi:small-conductance mechanosensitive channel
MSTTIISLSYFRNINIFAGPDDKKPTILEDFILPIALAIWPFTVALLVALLLFTISSDETTFATLSGIAIFILITGPLSIMLSIILIALTTLYRRNSNVEYPGFIYSAIDWTARKFSKHD